MITRRGIRHSIYETVQWILRHIWNQPAPRYFINGIEVDVGNELSGGINDILADYRTYDLTRQDRVIDLGANFGGFTLLAAQRGCTVLSIEPIVTDLLKKNVHRSGMASRIEIYPYAVGDGDVHEIEWNGIKKRIKTTPFTEVLIHMPQCTFLKCDIEGAEWYINPKDLSKIPRIEAELHKRGNYHIKDEWIKELFVSHEIEWTDYSINPLLYGIIHCYKK